MVNFKIKIVDKVLEINAFNESTKKYCGKFLSEEEPNYVITMTEEDLKNERTNSSDGKVYVNEEISALYRKIADLLVEDGIVVFHSSSFMVNNNAFLITARSGVGKSTHSRNLKALLGDKFVYINDDKPLLKVNENSVTVYGTPWNGKERRSNDVSAPLKKLNPGLKVMSRSSLYATDVPTGRQRLRNRSEQEFSLMKTDVLRKFAIQVSLRPKAG